MQRPKRPDRWLAGSSNIVSVISSNRTPAGISGRARLETVRTVSLSPSCAPPSITGIWANSIVPVMSVHRTATTHRELAAGSHDQEYVTASCPAQRIGINCRFRPASRLANFPIHSFHSAFSSVGSSLIAQSIGPSSTCKGYFTRGLSAIKVNFWFGRMSRRMLPNYSAYRVDSQSCLEPASSGHPRRSKPDVQVLTSQSCPACAPLSFPVVAERPFPGDRRERRSVHNGEPAGEPNPAPSPRLQLQPASGPVFPIAFVRLRGL